MKKLFRRFLGAAMTAALVLSLCVTAMAAQTTPPYAHLSVGEVKVSKLEAGDTVKIPVSLAGLESGDYLSGFSCVIERANTYLEITGVEFSSATNGWSGGYNAQYGSVNKVNLYFAEHPEDTMHSDGLLFTVVCKVLQDVPAGTSTGIEIGKVSMSMNSTDHGFLNSSDKTQAGLDPNAVVYPVDANGNPTGGVTVPEETTYTMTVAADKSEVTLDETVTVTVTVNGGAFNTAEYDLTYNPAYFQRTSAIPSSGYPKEDTEGVITDTYIGSQSAAGTVIRTYTFKALAQDTEVTGQFALSGAKVEAFGPVAGNADFCDVSDPAEVTIKLSDDLTVTADDVTVDYDGGEYGVTATANKAGAVIKYMDANGEYTLDESPKYSAVGHHTVKFQAALKGYVTAYGEAAVTINEPAYDVETTEYVAGYKLVLVYTNSATRFTYDGNTNTMLDVTAAGYSLNGTAYDHVYAWIVKYDEYNKSEIGYTAAAAQKVGYTVDVNASGKVDLRDVNTVVRVYNAEPAVMDDASIMDILLRADVDHSKVVDAFDYGAILASSSYSRG